MNRKQTLDAAAACVLTDRQRTHGPIEDSFGLIASLWSAYLSVPVTPFAVANMMTLLKIARAKGNPANADNQVDGAGYQACAAELAESMEVHEAEVREFRRGVQVVRGPDVHSDLVRELIDTLVATSAPNAAPVTPQSPPEGDHSQTDVRTQGDAIPLDCERMWHNPHKVDAATLESSDDWRLLLKDEMRVPDDAEVWTSQSLGVVWEESFRRGQSRHPGDTYRTKAPLPGTPSAPEPEWHNPENFTLSEEEKASGWRFLTKDEWKLPEDAMFKYHNGGPMMEWDVVDDPSRSAPVTYFTKAPLPGSNPEADNVHATTP